jgi:3-oxoadipate enol-lactonase
VKEGHGPTTIVLSHALGCDLSMWDEVVERLVQRYTVLRYDHRGHGRSPAVPGPCAIKDLADDAAALIELEADSSVHFVGQSMGGMVAQQIAVRHPHLIASIVVANSSSRYDDTFRGMWRSRQETAINLGMRAIADAVMPRWVTRTYRESEAGAERMSRLREGLRRFLRCRLAHRIQRDQSSRRLPDAGDRRFSRFGDAAGHVASDLQHHLRRGAGDHRRGSHQRRRAS